MKALIAFLIVFVLIGVMFIPIVEVCVEIETDKIVDIIDNSNIDIDSARDAALREASKAFWENVAESILSNECLEYERVNVVATRNNIDQWKVLFFLDDGYGYKAQESTIIDTFNIAGNNSIAFSGILCNAYNEIFTAFKFRLEHEQK